MKRIVLTVLFVIGVGVLIFSTEDPVGTLYFLFGFFIGIFFALTEDCRWKRYYLYKGIWAKLLGPDGRCMYEDYEKLERQMEGRKEWKGDDSNKKR